MERFQLNHDIQAQISGVVSQNLAVFHSELPLFFCGDHFLLPDVFTNHEQVILCLERGTHVEIAFAALNVEFLDRGVEIDQTNTHPHHADDGQLQFIAGLFDGANAILRVVIKWILKNIHAIEAQFLGFMQSVDQPDSVLFPRRINHPKFHNYYSPMISFSSMARCSSAL